jgi:hypothetical protein
MIWIEEVVGIVKLVDKAAATVELTDVEEIKERADGCAIRLGSLWLGLSNPYGDMAEAVQAVRPAVVLDPLPPPGDNNNNGGQENGGDGGGNP